MVEKPTPNEAPKDAEKAIPIIGSLPVDAQTLKQFAEKKVQEKEPVKEQGKQERDKEAKDVEERVQQIRIANDELPVPYEQVTKDTFRPEVTFEDLRKSITEKKWGQVVSQAFKLMFGDKNNVTGIGFAAEKFAEGLRNLPSAQVAGIFKQTERMDQKTDVEKKMRIGIASFESEFELYRRGFSRDRTVTADKTKTYAVQDGDTLESLAKKNVIGKEAWEQIQKGLKGEQDGVLGGISTDKKLPKGTFLYFDKDGFPIHLSPTKNDAPSVTLFTKTDATDRMNASKLDLLDARLQPGQIVLVNARKRNPIKQAYVALGRMFQAGKEQEETFFSVHPLIVKGRDAQGRIVLTDQVYTGSRQVLLRDILGPGKECDSIAVCSLPKPGDGAKLIEQASKLEGKFLYSYKKAFDIGVKRFKEKTGLSPTTGGEKVQHSGVCFDFIRQAAQEAGIPDLANAQSGLDMFKLLKLEYATEV